MNDEIITREDLKNLIDLAKKNYGDDITPCRNLTWEKSIKYYKKTNKIFLWFNAPSGTTCLLSKNLDINDVQHVAISLTNLYKNNCDNLFEDKKFISLSEADKKFVRDYVKKNL